MSKGKGKCKCKTAECEECPEWIFTFADLVMLMMGFFVILWVLKPAPGKSSPAQDADWEKIASAIRAAFGNNVPEITSTDPLDPEILKKLNQLKLQTSKGEKGEARIAPKGAEGTDPEVTKIRPGAESAVGGSIIFDDKSWSITPESRAAIDQIIPSIKGYRNIVLVKGHSSLDEFPEGATAEARMDLSLRRAQAVCDYLTSHGVSPDTVRVQGCSTFEPVVQLIYTPAGRAINRRVEIEVTTTLVSQRQDPSAATTEPASATPLSAPANTNSPASNR